MDEYTARQELEAIEMRKALWQWLMAQRSRHATSNKWPEPQPLAPSDEQVRADLARILLPKRKRFLGLF